MKDMHGIIFAYTSHMRLKELTEHRTAASIPFGGRYRCIDFMLSSMTGAGITNVGVIMRENYQSLLDHLGNGKNWDLSRKRGGLRILPPFGYAGSQREGSYRGRMEALFGVASYISTIRQEYVVLADGDIVANIDLDDFYKQHVASGADITCMCTRKQTEFPEDECYYSVPADGQIRDVMIGRHPDMPDQYEAMNVFLLSKQLLENLLTHCAARNLCNFNRDVLQAMKDKLRLHAYVFEGYNARLTSISSYFGHSMELLEADVRRQLFRGRNSIHTKIRDEAPTYYSPDSRVRNAVVADGCYIEGTVENSILFRGVRVAPGAVVQNSILMQDTCVKSGARLNYAISDKQVTVNENHMLMGNHKYPIAISKNANV